MQRIISQRLSLLEPSKTLMVSSLVRKFREEGKRVINLGVGEPDFETPLCIKKAAIRAIRDGFTRYTPVAGIDELRAEISKKLEKENNVSYKTQEIVVGVGSKQLLYNAFQVLCEKGDEVIIPTPTWTTYIEQVKLSGAKPVLVRLPKPFKLKAQRLFPYITARTKAIVINSPSNPTGAIVDKSELEELADICVKKGIFIISDEIYEKIIFGKKFYSIASLNEKIKRLTITINGFSKAYAMTGWRVGYAAGPVEIIEVMTRLQGQTTTNTSSISQKAAVAALRDSKQDVINMVREYKKRRDFVTKALSSIKVISGIKPDGTFYYFIDIRNLFNGKYSTSSEWSYELLTKYKVVVVPGEAFEAPGFIRISFTANLSDLKEGLKRIKKFVEYD